MEKGKKLKSDKPLEEPDVEFSAGAKMKWMHVEKAGKVEVENYSNIKHEEFHQSIRINMPDEIKDGETYESAEIQTRRENALDEEDAMPDEPES
ncbi:hypothetical protein RCC89_17670 [Cytophagaceae bacterium ABcell3]|nr:hypothetical protein RCC89_17670 [Cytophagaceae bacterium ABcell3]